MGENGGWWEYGRGGRYDEQRGGGVEVGEEEVCGMKRLI